MKALDYLYRMKKSYEEVGFEPTNIIEAIKELEDLQKNVEIITDDRRTLKDFVFTNCNDCINKIDNKFTEVCFNCKRYYGCYFEKKEQK